MGSPGMVGGDDGYYHLRMAALMRSDLTPEFTWLPLTILSPAAYVDHHWLFHVLLAPFATGDLVRAGQLAATVLATLPPLAIAALLARRGVPGAPLWALAVVGSSSGFVYRMSMPRAQSASLLWLVAALWLLLERRWRPLLPLGMTYVWLYDGFPLLMVLAVAYATTHRAIEGRAPWPALAWPAAGLAIGLVVNPFFPDNLVFLYHHLADKLAPSGIPVGGEWRPYATDQLVRKAGPALAALAAGAVALGWRRDRMDVATATAFAAALAFLAMLLQARRFVEYFPPWAMLFCALAWRPLLAGRQWPRAATLAASIGALTLALASVAAARADAAEDRPASDLAGPARWLAANTPKGSMVFQSDWDDFPRLFFYDTHNTYVVGLDPTYLSRADMARYRLWVDLTKGRGRDLSDGMARHFGARYAVTDLKHGAFLRRAASDPQLVERFRDGTGVVFEILPSDARR